MARRWEPGVVTGMLERAGDTDTRPDGLVDGSGLADGKYRLSAVQAQAILDLRLHRLTGLEQEKIVKEYKEILDKIQQFSDILANPDLLLGVIRDELEEMRDAYGDERKTEIVQDHSTGDRDHQLGPVLTKPAAHPLRERPVEVAEEGEATDDIADDVDDEPVAEAGAAGADAETGAEAEVAEPSPPESPETPAEPPADDPEKPA